jgi:uncharacterized coiled-coil protein SlyX
VSRKACAECKAPFDARRSTQRFCSTRCATRQRDRRPRQRIAGTAATPAGESRSECVDAAKGPRARPAGREATLAAGQARNSRLLDSLRAQLRLQSAKIDDLEAENAEQHATVHKLHVDLARLQTAQKCDGQDLVHLAGRLLGLSRAAGVELDPSTKELFRHRGWNNSRRGQQL